MAENNDNGPYVVSCFWVGVRLYRNGKRIDMATRREAMARFGQQTRFTNKAEAEAYRDTFPEDLRDMIEVCEAMDLYF